MGSRIRFIFFMCWFSAFCFCSQENPEKLFEVFLEIAKPGGQSESPFIVQTYPREYDDEETLKSVPGFAFPCDTDRYTMTTVDFFTFVLTENDSTLKFGYCRHATGAQTCLCIVSYLPWFEVFYNLLNQLAEMMNRNDDNDLTEFLRAAYAQDIPLPNVPVTIVANQEMLSFTAPDSNKLPTIPENRNLTEYYNALDTTNMMNIFASMLHERRILVTSKKLSRLSACVHTSVSLLFPMFWQHLFLPVLPSKLIDYLSAPTPYVLGIHSTLLVKIPESELGDAVIVDVDNNTITTSYDDLEDLPSEVSSYLRRNLKSEKVQMAMQTAGDAVPKTFLIALVRLIGGYRDALKFKPGEPITFDPEAFVQSRPSNIQPFLEYMLHLQMFQQFINDRLDMLNCGQGFSDIFEAEALAYADKHITQARYKEWLRNMKKQGSKFQKASKDAWQEVKSQSKKVYTGLKNKIEDLKKSPKILSEVKLDEEQKMQLIEAFASGTERDYCVRSNFVGFTGAGKTTLMWQLFLKIFNPKDIESTNGIDISLGYCNINLCTREWKRPEESGEEKRARRFQAITDVNKTQEDKKSGNEIIYSRTNSGIQTQQQRKPPPQQQQSNDSSIPQYKPNTPREPTDVSVTKAKSLGTAKPSDTKTDSHLIHRRITQAKSIDRQIEQEANATGIDYAGQTTYYALHQLFLSKRGVNIIVLDGSKDFDEDILDEDVRHIGSKTRANSKDFLKFWAKSLRYYLPERSSEHIITVFTHKDLVLNQDDLQKKICIVKEIIQDMGMTDLFFETIYCINANDPKDKVLQELRDIILNFSTGENHWGQKMPSRWLLFEDKLMQKKADGLQVMTLEEITEVHLKSALPLGSHNELLLFLKIHHEIGTLMYFADEGVTNIVILNPQWLIDSLKLIICAKRFRDHRYVKQWDRLHEKGVVDKDFLYSVWESHRQERFYEFREDLVLLMNKLDLIASPKTYNEKGGYVLSPYFIVPCMLHSAPKHFLQKYQNKATHRNLPLAFEFMHGFLPTATAYRVLATCVMEFGEWEEKETIFCDAAVFKVFEHHYMTLEFTSSSIIANVLTFGKTRANIGICKRLQEFLEDALKCIVSSQRVLTNYSLLVACGNEEEHKKPVWLKWSEVMQKPEIICEKHRNEPPHVVKTEEILKQWSFVPSAKGRLQSKRREIDKKPIPDEKPDDHFLGRVSRRIPSKEFQHLFIELGLNLDDIDRKERESPKQCILLLLLEWGRRPGSTYKQLADALFEQHEYVFDIEKMESCNSEWREEIPETFLVKEVADSTDLEFDMVCFMAGSSYLELGLELGLKKHEIDAIEKDNKKCLPITREVIKSWIDKNRPDDTWGVLGDALYEVGANPNFIESICNASRDTHS